MFLDTFCNLCCLVPFFLVFLKLLLLSSSFDCRQQPIQQCTDPWRIIMATMWPPWLPVRTKVALTVSFVIIFFFFSFRFFPLLHSPTNQPTNTHLLPIITNEWDDCLCYEGNSRTLHCYCCYFSVFLKFVWCMRLHSMCASVWPDFLLFFFFNHHHHLLCYVMPKTCLATSNNVTRQLIVARVLSSLLFWLPPMGFDVYLTFT